MGDLKRGMVHILDTLPQSDTCLGSTPTCPEYRCFCGALVDGIRVERAEFHGKVYQEAGWSFPELCPACEEKANPSLVIFDAVAAERLVIAKLTKIFGGERPAREYQMDAFVTDLENSEAFEFADCFHGQEDVYLWGPCGVGKTHLACAMVRTAVEMGKTAIAMKPSQLSRYLRVKEATVQEARIAELATADVLLIDELGIGKETDFALQILQEVLDVRADNYRRGLIITSNYSLADFALKIGEDAIPSRLRKMCRIIKIGGQDRRIK